MKVNQKGISVFIILAVLILSAWWNARETTAVRNGIRIHVPDVGQADCMIIETPDGNIMVDTGTDNSEGIVRAYLRSNGLTELQYLILSHPHDDHIGNADMIIREFTVEKVLCAESNSEEVVWQNFLSAMQEAKGAVEWIKPVTGNVVKVGDVRLEILMIPEAENMGENNDSLILRAEYGKCSILLMGDAESEAEEKLLSEVSADKLKVDMLKVGHHGSSGSSTEAFLHVVCPNIAVISSGDSNSFSHPHEETLYRLRNVGAEIYRTDLMGTLVFYCNGETFAVLRPR